MLLHVWRLPAGSTEYAIRFLSLLPSVAAVPLLYAIGRRIGGRRIGLAAAMLAGVNPYLVWLAQEARMYSWALLWTVLGAYLLLRALGSGRRIEWWLFGLANLLAVYTHLYSVFVVAAEGLYLLIRVRRDRDKALPGVAACIVDGLLFAPWFISITAFSGESSTWRGFIGVWDMLRVLGQNFASQAHLPGNLDDWFALLFAVLAAAGACGLLLRVHAADGVASKRALNMSPDLSLARLNERPGEPVAAVEAAFHPGSKSPHLAWPIAKGEGQARGLLLLWLLLPIAAVYALSFKEPLFSPRYFIVVLPAFLLLAAAGLAALPRGVALAGLAVLVAGSTWAIERGQLVPGYAKEDYRLAASYVGQRSEPGDAIALIANYIVYPFQYYFHGAGQVIPVDVQPNSSLDPLLAPLATHDHIWLVEAHDVFVDPRDRVGQWLRARYPVADEKYIVGIHFVEFDTHPTVARLPAGATPAASVFANGPRLAGYQLQSGPLAKVTLFWKAQPSPNYHLSIKLWGPNARLGGQQDGEPLNAGLPFSRFPSQGLVRDEHFVTAPPGDYDVRLSVYLPGQPDAGQVDLGTIRLR